MLAELWNDLRYRLRALTRGGESRSRDGGRNPGPPRQRSRRARTPRAAGVRSQTSGASRVRRPRERQGTEPRHARHQAPRRLHPGRKLCVAPHPPLAGAIADDRRTSGPDDRQRHLRLSAVNAVLLRPLPSEIPIASRSSGRTRANTAQNVVGGHEFPEWARSNRTFDGLSPMIYGRRRTPYRRRRSGGAARRSRRRDVLSGDGRSTSDWPDVHRRRGQRRARRRRDRATGCGGRGSPPTRRSSVAR